MASDNEKTFNINMEGETTKEKFVGSFTCKLRLSHRDSITKDNLRRTLLNGAPDTAGGRAASLAFLSSELAVRIVKSPNWYSGSDNGLDLEDDNVLAKIYELCTKAEKEAFEALHGKAEEAIPVIKAEIKEESKI
jgi:hypothetical protein